MKLGSTLKFVAITLAIASIMTKKVEKTETNKAENKQYTSIPQHQHIITHEGVISYF